MKEVWTYVLIFVLIAILMVGTMVAFGIYHQITSEPGHHQISIRATVNVRMPLVLSPDAQLGKNLYAQECQNCHGRMLEGSDKGPSLIVYDQTHHSDAVFTRAIQSGVPQHHWQFGDMPANPHLSDNEIKLIIGFIREVQHFNTHENNDE